MIGYESGDVGVRGAVHGSYYNGFVQWWSRIQLNKNRSKGIRHDIQTGQTFVADRFMDKQGDSASFLCVSKYFYMIIIREEK